MSKVAADEDNDHSRGSFVDLSKKPNYKTGEIPSDKVCPIYGCCLGMGGLYFECPSMIGCAHSLMCLCCTWDQMTCKPARKEEKGTTCCVLNRTSCDLKPSFALVKYRTQCCCYDARCAIPTGPQDYEFPCLLTFIGVTCCFNCKPKCGFCRRIGTLRGAGEE